MLPNNFTPQTSVTFASGQFGSIHSVPGKPKLAVKIVPLPTQASRRCSLVDIFSEIIALRMLSGVTSSSSSSKEKKEKEEILKKKKEKRNETSVQTKSKEEKEEDKEKEKENKEEEARNLHTQKQQRHQKKQKEEIVAVTLHEYGATEDGYYLIMERCDDSLIGWRRSESVVTRAKESPLEHLAICLDMFRRVLQKTIAMHDRGIVHYDLKCDNILVVRRSPQQFDVDDIKKEKNEKKKKTNRSNFEWLILERHTCPWVGAHTARAGQHWIEAPSALRVQRC